MTKTEVLKRLSRARSKHATSEANDVKQALKDGWVKTVTEFRPAVKYYTRLNVFKGSNVTFDPTSKQAYSYGWWRFVDVIKGKVVFNDHRYSNSTSNHQGSVRKLLRQLSIKVDLEIDVSRGLQELDSRTVVDYYTEMFNAEIAITNGRKGTHAHNRRLWTIRNCKKQIKACAKLGVKISKKQANEIKERIYAKAANEKLEHKNAIKAKREFLKNALKTTDLFQVA